MAHLTNGLAYRSSGAVALAVTLTCALAASGPAIAAGFDPNNPGRSGYQLTFDEEFNDASSMDLGKDPQPGFRWYARLFPVWGWLSKPKASVSDGVLTISGGQIATAAPAKDPHGHVGQAFSGGAYFEARLSFDPEKVKFDFHRPISNETNWWPSFYAVPVEFLTANAQWPGQPAGYVHFSELDFFEAWGEAYHFGGAVHDWYGPKGCGGHAGGLGYCDIANDGKKLSLAPNNVEIKMAPDNDWHGFHTVGLLWVSGERASDKRGFVQYYFDGKPTSDHVAWTAGNYDKSPPQGSSVFNVTDRDHFVVYLGSAANAPLRADWVHVWQLSGDGNGQAVGSQPGFSGGNGSHSASNAQ